MKTQAPLPWSFDRESPMHNIRIADANGNLVAWTCVPEFAEEIVAAPIMRNELAALLVEMTARYDRLERLYFAATNQTPDCHNGTIARATKAIAKATVDSAP